MNQATIEEILELISKAREARKAALKEENQRDFGYPFVAGYATSTLEQIQRILSAN